MLLSHSTSSSWLDNTEQRGDARRSSQPLRFERQRAHANLPSEPLGTAWVWWRATETNSYSALSWLDNTQQRDDAKRRIKRSSYDSSNKSELLSDTKSDIKDMENIKNRDDEIRKFNLKIEFFGKEEFHIPLSRCLQQMDNRRSYQTNNVGTGRGSKE